MVTNFFQAQERLLIAHLENGRCKCRLRSVRPPCMARLCPCPMIGIDAVLKAVPQSAFDVDVSTYCIIDTIAKMPTAPWHSGVARSSRNSRFNLGSMPQSTGLKVTLDVPLVFPKSSCARRPASFVLLATQPGKLVVRHPGRSNPVNASRPLIRQRGSSRGSARFAWSSGRWPH